MGYLFITISALCVGNQYILGKIYDRKVGNSNSFCYTFLIASVVFGCALVLGAIVFSLLFALPLYYPYIKMYSDPAAPSVNMFGLAWRSFAGGFAGVNAVSADANPWNIFYLLSRTDGEAFSGVYGAFMNPVAILAALAGLAYAVYNAVRLIRAKEWGKDERSLLRRTVMPLAGLVLSLVTAVFAKDAVGFVLLGWIFLFMLAAYAVGDFTAREGRTGKVSRVLSWVGFGLLAAMFVLYFVFASAEFAALCAPKGNKGRI